MGGGGGECRFDRERKPEKKEEKKKRNKEE